MYYYTCEQWLTWGKLVSWFYLELFAFMEKNVTTKDKNMDKG